MAAAQILTVERDGVFEIRLNRPESRNALGRVALDELDAALSSAEASPGARLVVIRAHAEGAFSTGADLKEFAAADADDAWRVIARGHAVLRRVETLAKPVVAVVDGIAVGGGLELCLACSLILASDRAQFGLPESGLGLIPGYGGTQRLSRLIGRQRALRVMLTGERLDADAAFDLGLLPYPPVPAAELDTETERLCAAVAAKSPAALHRVLRSVDVATRSDLLTGLEYERMLAWQARLSTDAEEGITAFLEKRPPRFPGLSVDALGAPGDPHGAVAPAEATSVRGSHDA